MRGKCLHSCGVPCTNRLREPCFEVPPTCSHKGSKQISSASSAPRRASLKASSLSVFEALCAAERASMQALCCNNPPGDSTCMTCIACALAEAIRPASTGALGPPPMPLERFHRNSTCGPAAANRGNQNSRLASQLAAKMMHHSFHERLHLSYQLRIQITGVASQLAAMTVNHPFHACMCASVLPGGVTD
eukprot:scaffold56320_cov23-Tisochrysis_lutea.AAC.2